MNTSREGRLELSSEQTDARNGSWSSQDEGDEEDQEG